MPLTKLQFRPGINREITAYSNEGGWVDCDKVRFRFGYPEKIGGWEKYGNNSYVGSARALHNWIALDGSNYLGVGTHLKYYIEEGQTFSDITPIRNTTAAGDVTFTANYEMAVSAASGQFTIGETITGGTSSATATVTYAPISGATGVIYFSISSLTGTFTNGETVTGGTSSETATIATPALSDFVVGNDNSHGAVENDFVTFSGSTSLGGDITAAVLDQEYQITNIIDANSYGFTATATATASDTGSGGTTTVGVYQINVGLDTSVGGTGWGAGTWGRDGWGDADSSGLSTINEIRLWSHDNFGEDLIINPRDSAIYYWDKSSGLAARAVEIGTLGGASQTPVIAKQVLVSDQDRHVLAFGCNPQGSATQDPLLIRFSDQESITEWNATATTTAGDLRLGSGSTFVQALETKREILVWTDTSLSSLRYIGPPFTFGLQQLSSNITIMGPNAAVATEDFVFWMGIDNFYIYAGQTQQLPCPVKDKVFLDFNLNQTDKVYAGINSEFGEVIWFYPSDTNAVANGGDGQNDRYVIYNYNEKVWYYGSITRSAWLDRGTRSYPIAAGGGYLYNHELGYDNDGVAMDSFIESAPIDIGDGDKFVYVRRIIPDLTFNGSTNLSSPQATFTLKTRDFPGQSFSDDSAGTVTRTATSPVENFTNQLHMRARGRSFAMKVESEALGARWKLGSPRIDIREDGKR